MKPLCLFTFFTLLFAAHSQTVSAALPDPNPHLHPRAVLTSGTLPGTRQLVVSWPNTAIQIDLVRVPGGRSFMGGHHGDPDELPVHSLDLGTYWIGKYEITADQYAFFLNRVHQDRVNGHRYLLDPADPSALIRRESKEYQPLQGFGDFPAAGISWYGAKAFCDWMRKSTGLPIDLPTEAQWEKAAHGEREQDHIFPWGVRLNPSLARYKSNQPTRVGKYPKGISPCGAYDMAGNVAEWVKDWYDPDYYAKSPNDDPTGPTTGTLKILRGGDWTDAMLTIPKLRTADRDPTQPDSVALTQGFRIALDGDFPAARVHKVKRP